MIKMRRAVVDFLSKTKHKAVTFKANDTTEDIT